MPEIELKYLMKCPVCGKTFYVKRKHANTCSPRCRFIMFKLKGDHSKLCNINESGIAKMNKEQMKLKIEFVRQNKMLDINGNPFELIDGYIDDKGDIIRLVFRNTALKYIESWDLIENEVKERVFR